MLAWYFVLCSDYHQKSALFVMVGISFFLDSKDFLSGRHFVLRKQWDHNRQYISF